MALDWFPTCYSHHIWFRKQFKFNGTCVRNLTFCSWFLLAVSFFHRCLLPVFVWLPSELSGLPRPVLFGLCLVSPLPDCIKRCLFGVLSDVIVPFQMFRINHSWYSCSSVGPLIPKHTVYSTPTEDRLGALYCLLVARLLVTCSWSQTAFDCPKFKIHLWFYKKNVFYQARNNQHDCELQWCSLLCIKPKLIMCQIEMCD